MIYTTTAKAENPQLLTYGCGFKKSFQFLNNVEIHVDSLIIPAFTLGEAEEIRPDGEGGLNMLVVKFLTTNRKEISFNFIRKDLVSEKKPKSRKKIEQSFILVGPAEAGYKYRHKIIIKSVPSIPKDGPEDCALLFMK